LQPMPLDNGWPADEQWWKTYGGKLTPRGVKDHHAIGGLLASFYQEQLRLVPDDQFFSNEVYVYTSNTDRTLLSANAFLTGFCPNLAVNFSVEGETDEVASQGVRIRVADPKYKSRPVLHGYVGSNKYSLMMSKAENECAFFRSIEKDPKYLELLDKMWKMTHYHKIDPKLPVFQRFLGMKDVYQEIEVERSLHMIVLLSKSGITLTHQDEDLLQNIRDAGMRVKFQGNNAEEQLEMGRGAAGLLPNNIIESFKDRIRSVENKVGQKRKFVLYSAHDYTINAVLSHMGFRELPIASVASHLIFELHQQNGKFFVRMGYNHNPMVIKTMEKYQYRTLPEGRAVVDWDKAPTEQQSFEVFEKILMSERRSFVSEKDWKEDGDSVTLPPGFVADS